MLHRLGRGGGQGERDEDAHHDGDAVMSPVRLAALGEEKIALAGVLGCELIGEARGGECHRAVEGRW
jgi:hypothetical protein